VLYSKWNSKILVNFGKKTKKSQSWSPVEIYRLKIISLFLIGGAEAPQQNAEDEDSEIEVHVHRRLQKDQHKVFRPGPHRIRKPGPGDYRRHGRCKSALLPLLHKQPSVLLGNVLFLCVNRKESELKFVLQTGKEARHDSLVLNWQTCVYEKSLHSWISTKRGELCRRACSLLGENYAFRGP
jgi:hypothetical protein